jgi:hypothetical protein
MTTPKRIGTTVVAGSASWRTSECAVRLRRFALTASPPKGLTIAPRSRYETTRTLASPSPTPGDEIASRSAGRTIP